MASQRKNKIKIKIVPRYLFIVMVVICLILLLVSYRFSDSLGPVKTAVGDVITPMQVGINKVGSYFTSKLDYFKNIGVDVRNFNWPTCLHDRIENNHVNCFYMTSFHASEYLSKNILNIPIWQEMKDC